jgi:dTDP-4-amino-4,6-dideoxygalactose transaminase
MAAPAAGLPEIPFTDLRLEPEDVQAVAETLRSGWLTMGPRTEAFERAFAEQLGCRHALAVSSCTAALHLAYLAAGVGPGDEVIVPSLTFVATASAVIYAGGTPVFADIRGLHDVGIDPAAVEAAITPRTKAVTAVHFAGYPAAVDELAALCRARGLALIEDAAHAPSATLDERKLGTWGLAGCFSLFSNKILSVGEGGLICTDDDAVAEQARRLRSQGMTSGTWERHRKQTTTYDVQGLGFNYRLDEPRSALALSRLARLEADIERRRELVREYRRRLAEIEGVIVPYSDEDVQRSSCYVMPIMLREHARRDELRLRLRERHGVQTSVFYPAIHEFSAYRERTAGASLPRTELAARSEVTLPLYPHMTAAEQERVLAGLAEELAG